MDLTWKYKHEGVDWKALSHLYTIAPLGNKQPADLKEVFGNSRYQCFVYYGSQLVGVGRALADGVDCSYLCDVAVHPDFQGAGMGKDIILKLVHLSQGHKKIILYANPGTEIFYRKLGFHPMNTAMAIFKNSEQAMQSGLIRE